MKRILFLCNTLNQGTTRVTNKESLNSHQKYEFKTLNLRKGEVQEDDIYI
ncbi:unnamed protein product [Trifolium pratense]|uniref:Uncharacterized protein n=1 Tax=Trifolium pratense TaxID=57577 RepID=A0ACB0J8H9_TRIPR|nr:unnamed protein product [Trifolium pratense]